MPRHKKKHTSSTINNKHGAEENRIIESTNTKRRSTKKKQAVEPLFLMSEIIPDEAGIALEKKVDEHLAYKKSKVRSICEAYFFYVVVLVCVMSVTTVYLYRSHVYTFLDSLYLIPKKETFTELYLNEYPQVSERLLVSKKTYPFIFTIRNHEGKTTAYPYEVYFKNTAGVIRKISNRSIVIEDGESVVIREEFFVQDPKEKGTVAIRLIDLNQEIHFFIPIKY